MITKEELKSKINAAARQGEKFLFAIDYEMNECIFVENPLECKDILWRTPKAANFCQTEVIEPADLSPKYISFEQYTDKFETIYNGLYGGRSFLANLTVKTPLGGDISLENIALSAKSKYLLYVPERFVSFSPEPFVRVSESGQISSYPMKGTIDAAIPDAEQTLLNNYKERAEHSTIVDLIRSDLSRVATKVNLNKFCYIDRLSTVNGEILQMSSEIVGDLLPEFSDKYGDMLFELLPAGSISGAPKRATVELIGDAEGEKRGFYSGVFGYYDGSEFDSAVLIRYIEKQGDRFYYRSGGGITINSEKKSEYEEVNSKIYITR